MSSLVLVTGATGLIGFRVLVETLREGYSVRFVARSEEKAQKVLSRPVIQSLKAEDRLSHVLVPDVSVEGAYDEALQGVSYVLHVARPCQSRPMIPSRKSTSPQCRGSQAY
ncbi:hypothetical protein BDV59DRAFT_180096 [Aspergillus ambiguus]|uniref:uncharacterized protein n=1 Tax=Aspergillus ambiguus TaxID=176160 RepID=UPI003CCD2821